MLNDLKTSDKEYITRELIDDKGNIYGHRYIGDIVRCQDCKYWVCNFNGCSRNPCTEPWYATDFCSYGERSSDEQ